MDENRDFPILPETHTSMYLMHKWWARKPANIVVHYIEKYCPKNGTILDPFMGSGVTVLESVFSGRKAIGIDVNPMASFITKMTGVEVDINEFQAVYTSLDQLIHAPDSIYSKLYLLPCPYCQKPSHLTHLIWIQEKDPFNTENNNQIMKNEQIQEIRLQCSTCGTKSITNSDSDHFSPLVSILLQQEENAFSYLTTQNIPPSILSSISRTFEYPDHIPFLQLRHRLRTHNTIPYLFTSRSLAFLVFLYYTIQKLPQVTPSIRDLVLFCFTSNLAQCSKMVWVIKQRHTLSLPKTQVGSWTHHFFWDPTEFFEVNAWTSFRQRYRKILLGKRQSNQRNQESLLKFRLCSNFSELSDDFPALLLTQSSVHLPLPENAIDFIFTDPPYGDSIQYGELASFWNVWLNPHEFDQHLTLLKKHEITINNHQQKSFDSYTSQITQVFSECFRVLKPNGYMVVTFHSTSIKLRNALITSVINAGFNLIQILFQLPPRVSIKSMLHHAGSPIGDYYIRFQKKDHQMRLSAKKRSSISPKMNSIDHIREIIKNILRQRGEPTSFLWISNLLDEELCKIGLFPLPEIETILNLLQSSDIFTVTEDRIWWVKDLGVLSPCQPPLSSRIEQFLHEYLLTHTITHQSKTYKQELFNLIYSYFNGLDTPDKFLINQVIERLIKERSMSLGFNNRYKNKKN